MENNIIRVLLVEASPAMQQVLFQVISSDPRLHVTGIASNGREALEKLKQARPDVITIDLNMPRMDGFEATRRIMELQAIPIIIVTASLNGRDVATSFQAVEAGAVAVLEKPGGIGHPNFEDDARKLIETIKLMSEVKVIRRRWVSSSSNSTQVFRQPQADQKIAGQIKLVAIGSSTGGPPALQKILSKLPEHFPVPILIVQHIAEKFSQGLADWLNESTNLRVCLAQDGERIAAGNCYLAPDNSQMKLEKGGRIVLTDDLPEYGTRPSVSYLFRSVAETCPGHAVGILLTGMGKDGAAELKLMRDRGAMTIAQDKTTSIVHGMPGEAIRLGAAVQILPLDHIAPALQRLVCQTKTVNRYG